MEAFSDGVLAIIITIMVLEIKVPHGSQWEALKPLIPTFISYVLSFTFVGVYWANHHHMLQSVKSVTGSMIWANINLLFWLSLIPFTTGWMGENNFAPNTIAAYGIVLLLSGVAYTILQKVIENHSLNIERLKTAFVNMKRKGIASMIGYSMAIPLAYISPVISGCIFILIAIVWLLPDKNIEEALKETKE